MELGIVAKTLDDFPSVAPISTGDTSSKGKIVGSNKTKAELITENEALRKRVEILERNKNQEPFMQPGLLGEAERGEEADREIEGKLRSVIDNIPASITLKNLDGRITLVNREYSKRRGIAAENIIGKTIREIQPEIAELMDALEKEVVETGGVVEREVDVSFGDGSKHTILNTKFPMMDAAGRIAGVASINPDITERKVAEETLRLSEEKFRVIFHNTPAMMVLKDLQGRFTLMNPSYELWYGISASEAIGKTTHDLFPKDDADRAVAQDHETLTSGEPVEQEFWLNHPDGTRRRVVTCKFPIIGGNGQAIGTGTITTDVTEQRRLEEQLRESQKMDAVGQLAGGIAHEFNNMLQVIINGAHFARNSIHEPEVVETFLGTILKSAERSAALTKQLLAYGRKTPMVWATVNLNALTANLMKMVKPIIGEDIQLDFKQADNLHPVMADPSMVEQSVVNLCINARDAMPDGGRLMFETRNHHADQEYCDIHGWKHPGDYAMISVRDNGIGMSAETREHIFEPFFTTKEVGEGTGLGLAMVHGIVQQHDGVVEAFSEPGVGSIFNIYLPMAESQEVKTKETVARKITGGNETVLVAEDEEDVLNMLAKTLESKGYRVFAAKDGEEAMAVFEANADRIDLVILDMVMPKLRGRQVYEKIRESGSDVPVVFSTGYSLDSKDAEYIAGKGLRTIQKPYAPDVLFTAVREVLDQR